VTAIIDYSAKIDPKTRGIGMFDKLEKIYEQIQNQLNVYEIGEKISGFIIEEFQAEVCEIKYLEENEVFFRIHCALREKDTVIHDQDEIEKRFGIKKTPADGSLIGYCTEKSKNFVWIKKDIDFKTWVLKKKKEPVHTESALRYLQKMPSGSINNFLVLPIIIPKDRRKSETHTARVCFHIFNTCNGSIDEDEINRHIQGINKAFNYISVILFNAIFFSRARNEIHINRKIEEITTKAVNIENVLEGIASEFANRLQSPLTTIWFPDHKLRLLVLHSFYIKTNYFKEPVDEKEIREVIETRVPKILRADECLIGEIFNNKDLPWIKINNLNEDPEAQKYKWGIINAMLKTFRFIALPIRARDVLIAIIVLHPGKSESDFEKIPLSYFRSFTSQISTTLRYFIAKSFSDKANQLSEKLTPLVTKREEIFYNELVFKIMEVIEAEACSIFEARGGDHSEKGIYLKATTDKRDKVRKRIGTKIYDINSWSITGHVAFTGKPIIVYDVERVHDFIPEIEAMSKFLMEKTTSPLHKSYIAVPIPVGKQNFDDRRASVLILRCINKKKTANRTLTGIFTVDDMQLLKHVAVVLESFNLAINVLYERNDLIDLIIHEIENPIVSIRGKIDFIITQREKDKLFEEKLLNQKLKDIEEMSSLLKGWAGSMGTLNQLMQGKPLSPTVEWVRLLDDIIKDVKYWMSPVLKVNGINPSDIEMDGFDSQLKVYVDKDHLKQVFYNLLSNAVKYSKHNEKTRISIEASKTGDGVIVKVKDWGVGTCSDDLAQIFKMGVRGNYAKRANIKGKGFGLWLCQKLLESNGLEIRVGRCANPTIFEVIIPRKLCN